jgi:hypothetical protein
MSATFEEGVQSAFRVANEVAQSDLARGVTVASGGPPLSAEVREQSDQKSQRVVRGLRSIRSEAAEVIVASPLGREVALALRVAESVGRNEQATL